MHVVATRHARPLCMCAGQSCWCWQTSRMPSMCVLGSPATGDGKAGAVLLVVENLMPALCVCVRAAGERCYRYSCGVG